MANDVQVETKRNNFYYTRIIINDASYSKEPSILFPFTPTHMIISRRPDCFDSQILQWAVRCPRQGDEVDGELFMDDGPLALDGGNWTSLWLKGEFLSQPMEVRVWAWRK